MAVYKVPQDVEADDKLIGPFSFRQFIYLIVVAICGGIAWGLFLVFPLLALLPLPLILFFGALALPLKKDQPMEVYLAAIVSFHLKPRQRFWEADGIQSLVQITAPKVVENPLIKDISIDEAAKRLSYLADISDTHGWAVRGVASPDDGSNLSQDLYLEAKDAVDVLDDSNEVSQSFDSKLAEASQQRRETMMKNLQSSSAAESQPATQVAATAAAEPATKLGTAANPQPQPEPQPEPALAPNEAAKPSVPVEAADAPVVAEVSAPSAQTNNQPPSTSEKPPSTDILELANNRPDLSIQSIAHEAKRLHDKETEEQEVVISLR